MIVRAVGGAEAVQPSCKLGTCFVISLILTEPIFNNFQKNGLFGKTSKIWVLDKNVIFMNYRIIDRKVDLLHKMHMNLAGQDEKKEMMPHE